LLYYFSSFQKQGAVPVPPVDTAACLSVSFYFLVRCKTKVVWKIGRRRCSEMVNLESAPGSIRFK